MDEFKVIEIVDAVTIRTLPQWMWTNRDGVDLTGNMVRVKGLLHISPENANAREILKNLLIDEYVTLSDPGEVPGRKDIIECEVQLNEVDISVYFPKPEKH
jgi:hypothetical protein